MRILQSPLDTLRPQLLIKVVELPSQQREGPHEAQTQQLPFPSFASYSWPPEFISYSAATPSFITASRYCRSAKRISLEYHIGFLIKWYLFPLKAIIVEDLRLYFWSIAWGGVIVIDLASVQTLRAKIILEHF